MLKSSEKQRARCFQKSKTRWTWSTRGATARVDPLCTSLAETADEVSSTAAQFSFRIPASSSSPLSRLFTAVAGEMPCVRARLFCPVSRAVRVQRNMRDPCSAIPPYLNNARVLTERGPIKALPGINPTNETKDRVPGTRPQLADGPLAPVSTEQRGCVVRLWLAPKISFERAVPLEAAEYEPAVVAWKENDVIARLTVQLCIIAQAKRGSA